MNDGLEPTISGIAVIDKPEGMTSHDVVNKVRLRFRGTKVGHLGTLDPMATGVLPICLGKATRIGQFLDGGLKEYVGEMRFGFATTTYDRTGQAVAPDQPFAHTLESVCAAMAGFTGLIEQVPPPFSAKKIGGVPSYKFARRGRSIATPAVAVTVETFEVTGFDSPFLKFRAVCSPGTYVRSLAHDLGQTLGCGAHLTSLRRTRSGGFTASQAVGLEGLNEACVIPLEGILSGWPQVDVDDDQIDRIVHGNPVPAQPGARQFARILNKRGEFLAVGVLENGWVRPKVVLTSITSKST
jgi:tRNA pseudouridine55 synthase